jgi:preprotein translocase subunit Sss1
MGKLLWTVEIINFAKIQALDFLFVCYYGYSIYIILKF